MPTQKPRISLARDPGIASLLGEMTQLSHQPTSGLAKELILEVLGYRAE